MVIAVLEMMLPRGNETVTIRALRAFWDSTCARPGCVGGGVFQEVGRPETALYIEMWQKGRAAHEEIGANTLLIFFRCKSRPRGRDPRGRGECDEPLMV